MRLHLVEVRQRHQEYLAHHRAVGGKLLSYQTPCCGHQQETAAAGSGEKWDSAAVCLGCGSLYWRVITDDRVEVRS
ncbi:hypothetical protein [Aeromonas veronii]|uniref:hypothetical protein n=1 Tax=Aeromonas veronii TaxID=654 RepID=UPI003D25EF81